MQYETEGTLHMAWCKAGIVAVRCLTCWHGDLLDDKVFPMIQRGNLKKVADLKFKCSICGERNIKTEIPATHEAAAEFLARPVPA